MGQGREKEATGGNRHWCLLSGAAEKPYLVEEAVSYNELDYVSVSPGSALGVCYRAGQPALKATEQPLGWASSSLRASPVPEAGGNNQA